MSKLRLLITPECNRACVGCCNDAYDLGALPKVSGYREFEEIMLTGGEPMLDPIKVMDTLQAIRDDVFVMPKIYLYTAMTKPRMPLLMLLYNTYLTGITLSLHEQYDIAGFRLFNKLLRKHPDLTVDKSLRLNVVSHVDITLVDTSLWDVKIIEWKPDGCPLPKDEVFARI